MKPVLQMVLRLRAPHGRHRPWHHLFAHPTKLLQIILDLVEAQREEGIQEVLVLLDFEPEAHAANSAAAEMPDWSVSVK